MVEVQTADVRGYALLHVKAADPYTRTFSGFATTPELDRQGHIVDPAGVRFRNPLPLLWHHDQARPVGTATLYPPTPEGIPFEARLPTIAAPGALRDRIEEAWESIRAGLVTGVSIGFRVLNNAVARLKGGAVRFDQVEVVELSLVTIPANMHASILVVKQLAASGLSPVPALRDLPVVRVPKGAPAMGPTLNEQIASFEASRSAKAARMVALMHDSSDAGVTLDDAQTQEYDGLDREVKSLDDHLARLRRLEGLQVQTAAPVAPRPIAAPMPIVQVKAMVPKGTAFIRGCMAIAASRGNPMQAVEIAKQWKDSTPEVELWLKAAVAPGDTLTPAWAGALAVVQNISNEFIELLRPATILGRIPNLRQVPFLTAVPVQTAGGSYGWVGEAKPKPVTKLGFSQATLPIAKASGIIVMTEELVRSSSPSAEAIVRADMIAGIAQFLDQQFIDPAVGPVVQVSPASITNGTTPIVTTGSALKDIQALVGAFTAAAVPLAGAALVLSETNAFTLGLLRDASGALLFPNVSAQGGTAFGFNVVASNAAGTNVVLIQPRYILYADDGGVNIDVSREASLQMDSAPMSPADATVVMTSLWQNNLVGLRAERFINWLRALPVSVKYVSGAAYVPTVVGDVVPQEATAKNGRRAAAGE
jgi:HK97 family phage major capsid protein/HK97 family phage prohead protease